MNQISINLPDFMNMKQIREIFKNEELDENQCISRYIFMCHVFEEFNFEFTTWNDFLNINKFFLDHSAIFLWEKNFQESNGKTQKLNDKTHEFEKKSSKSNISKRKQ